MPLKFPQFRTRRDESTRFAPGEIDADSAVELVVRYPVEAPVPVKSISILAAATSSAEEAKAALSKLASSRTR